MKYNNGNIGIGAKCPTHMLNVSGVTGVTTSQYERFIIHKHGNVGIGTNSPSHKLDVVGNVTAQELEIQEDFSWFDKKLFSAVRWYCNKRKITVLFQNKRDCVSPNENLIIYTNGSVGIGC